MRYKRRYILLKLTGCSSVEEFEKSVYSVMNRMAPTLGIEANFKIIKDLYLHDENCVMGVISVNNKYKYRLMFILSMMKRFTPFNLITLKSGGSLKHIKMEEKKYGTDTSRDGGLRQGHNAVQS